MYQRVSHYPEEKVLKIGLNTHYVSGESLGPLRVAEGGMRLCRHW